MKITTAKRDEAASAQGSAPEVQREDVHRIYEIAEAALQEAADHKADFGAVNWADLGVHEIERRECLLTGYEPYVAVMIEEGDCGKLQAFVAKRLKDAGFPDMVVEVEW